MSQSKEYLSLLNFAFWYLNTISSLKHCFTKMSVAPFIILKIHIVSENWVRTPLLFMLFVIKRICKGHGIKDTY